MVVTAFRADGGQCVLVRGQDGRSILVDGGTAAQYRAHIGPALALLRRAARALDRVCLSAPVLGRIDGVRQLFDDVVGWYVADYQRSNGNRTVRYPIESRPPTVRGVWFNPIHEIGGSDSVAVQQQLEAQASWLALGNASGSAAATTLLAAMQESELLARRLRQLHISLNPELQGGVIYLRDSMTAFAVGEMRVHVIGPLAEDLERSRSDWARWLRDTAEARSRLMERASLQAAVLAASAGPNRHDSVFALAAALQPGAADLPDFPSIVLLLIEGSASALFTGEATADAILSGLARQGRLDSNGTVQIDVLQVPSSDTTEMIRREFFRRVTADHYLVAGNGENGQPSANLIEALFSARSGAADARPFTLWFNSDLEATESARNADVLRSLIDERVRASGGRARCRFISRGASALQIAVGPDSEAGRQPHRTREA